jgi:small subunit ribosomal protein S19
VKSVARKQQSIQKFSKKKEERSETKLFQKIWSRRSCILPQFLGLYTQIYNGRKWIGLKVTEDMIGHKFGEFASTRTIGRTHAEKLSNVKMKTNLKSKIR